MPNANVQHLIHHNIVGYFLDAAPSMNNKIYAVGVYYPYPDVTPHHLIALLDTDGGIIWSKSVASLRGSIFNQISVLSDGTAVVGCRSSSEALRIDHQGNVLFHVVLDSVTTAPNESPVLCSRAVLGDDNHLYFTRHHETLNGYFKIIITQLDGTVVFDGGYAVSNFAATRYDILEVREEVALISADGIPINQGKAEAREQQRLYQIYLPKNLPDDPGQLQILSYERLTSQQYVDDSIPDRSYDYVYQEPYAYTLRSIRHVGQDFRFGFNDNFHLIYKADRNLNKIYESKIYFPSNVSSLEFDKTITPLSDGGLLISGNAKINNITRPFILRLSPDGDLVASNYYLGDYSRFYKVLELSDHRIVAFGGTKTGIDVDQGLPHPVLTFLSENLELLD